MSADAVRALLERPPALGRHGVEHLLQVLDAMASDLQRKGRGLAREAPIAAPDRAGGDEAVAFEAAVALAQWPAHGVSPVHQEPVAQPRPVWQRYFLLHGPIQRQLAVEAHRAGDAFAMLADVDERVATVGAQHGIACPVVIEGWPAEDERPVLVAPRGTHRVLALDRRPWPTGQGVVRIRVDARPGGVVRHDVGVARPEKGAPVTHPRAALDE